MRWTNYQSCDDSYQCLPAGLQRQYVALPSSAGLRLPLSGLANNASAFSIAIGQGESGNQTHPSQSRDFPLTSSQASVLLTNVTLTVASADTLQSLFLRYHTLEREGNTGRREAVSRRRRDWRVQACMLYLIRLALLRASKSLQLTSLSVCHICHNV